MRKLIITSLFFLLPVAFCLGQKSVDLSGTIKNYNKQSLYLYKCGIYPDKGGTDTLLLADSTVTDAKGKFSLNFSKTSNFSKVNGMYKVVLQRNQSFYILFDGKPIEIKTVYIPDIFYNIATDSLSFSSLPTKEVGREEGAAFLEFQRLQKHLNVANYFLLQMMRLYPLPDPFHKNIEDEYFERYNAMKKFINREIKERPEWLSTKIAKAYYIPDCPDWKQPDDWRDSIIASHYFDYFNPSDSFYLHTNILSEKMDVYLALRTNKRDDYGQPIYSEQLFADAAIHFIDKTISNLNTQYSILNTHFCLNYYLKKFNKEHKEHSFLSLYDTYLKTPKSDCGSSQTDEFTWARKKTDILKNVQIGSIAPDFAFYPLEIVSAKMDKVKIDTLSQGVKDGMLNLSSIQSDYILLIFWATWCPHCTQVLPEIKKVVDNFNTPSLEFIPIKEGGGAGGGGLPPLSYP